MVGDVRTYASENYTSVPVDLSKYIGKEVIIAIGTFRAQTGDYWKQLVLRRIAFAKEAVEGWGWLPGTSVEELDGWEMTREMVRSTMPQMKSKFTGLSPVEGNRDNYVDAIVHGARRTIFVPSGRICRSVKILRYSLPKAI